MFNVLCTFIRLDYFDLPVAMVFSVLNLRFMNIPLLSSSLYC